jgi:hypothetical protein
MFRLNLFVVSDRKCFGEIMLQSYITAPQTILADIDREFLAQN